MSGAVGAAAGLLIGSVNLCAQDDPPQENPGPKQTLQRMMERRRLELGGGDISEGEAGSSRLDLEHSVPGNFDPAQTRQRMMERRRAELGDQAVEPPPPGRGYGERGQNEFRGVPGAQGGPPPMRGGRGQYGGFGPRDNPQQGPGNYGGQGFHGGRGGPGGPPPMMDRGGRGFRGYGPQNWDRQGNPRGRRGRGGFHGAPGAQGGPPPMRDGRGQYGGFGPRDDPQQGPGNYGGQGFREGRGGRGGPPPIMGGGGRGFGGE